MGEIEILTKKAKEMLERQDRFISAMDNYDMMGMYEVFVEEELSNMESFSDIPQDPEAKAQVALIVASCSMTLRDGLADVEKTREKYNSISEGQ